MHGITKELSTEILPKNEETVKGLPILVNFVIMSDKRIKF